VGCAQKRIDSGHAASKSTGHAWAKLRKWSCPTRTQSLQCPSKNYAVKKNLQSIHQESPINWAFPVDRGWPARPVLEHDRPWRRVPALSPGGVTVVEARGPIRL